VYFFAPAIAWAHGWCCYIRKPGIGWGMRNSLATTSLVHSVSCTSWRVSADALHFLFIADGRFIGTIALFAGFRMLRGKEGKIAGLVAIAQVVVVTVLGYAMLERYLIPCCRSSMPRLQRPRLSIHRAGAGFLTRRWPLCW